MTYILAFRWWCYLQLRVRQKHFRIVLRESRTEHVVVVVEIKPVIVKHRLWPLNHFDCLLKSLLKVTSVHCSHLMWLWKGLFYHCIQLFISKLRNLKLNRYLYHFSHSVWQNSQWQMAFFLPPANQMTQRDKPWLMPWTCRSFQSRRGWVLPLMKFIHLDLSWWQHDLISWQQWFLKMIVASYKCHSE